MKAFHEMERLDLQELIAQTKLALELRESARGLGRIINSGQFLVRSCLAARRGKVRRNECECSGI